MTVAAALCQQMTSTLNPDMSPFPGGVSKLHGSRLIA